ncbi:hypothetical protein Tco_0272372 [Tanacetum coccineum]
MLVYKVQIRVLRAFGATRLFQTNEEHQNVPREEGQRGNSVSISATTRISDLEQKTFTRSEIKRLTALLHLRSNELSSEDVVERDGANPCSSPSSFLRLEGSTSGSLKKHGDERDDLHAPISKPMVTSRVLEEEIASPAELAKAYMGSRPSKIALRQDLVLHNNVTGFLKSPNMLVSPKIANGSTGVENGFTKPRSRGRSAMYNMARTPYARSTKAYMDSGPYKVAQRQDLVLHNNTTGFLKSPNILISPKITIGSTGFENGFTTPRSRGRSAMYHMARTPYARYPSTFTQKRLTRLGDGDKANISNDSHVLRLKASKSGPLNKHAEERENFHAVISTPRAFEEDVPSPVLLAKPRSRGRTTMYRMARSPYYRGRSTLSKKPTPSLIYSQPAWELEGSNGSKMAGKSRSSVLDDLGSGGPMRRIRQKANLHPTPLLISSQPTWELEGSNGSKMPGKSRSSVLDDLGSGGPMRRTRQKTPSLISSQPAWELEGSNGSKMFDSGKRRSYVLNDLGSGGPMRRIWQIADLCSQKKKHPFQMSAREDDLFELDDDDETRVNGHIPLLLVESNKQKTALTADIVATSTHSGVSRTPALVEPPKKKPAFQMSAPEDDSFERDDNDETQVNGHVSLLPMDNVVLERDSNSFTLFSTSAKRASPFASSANGLSDSKPSASSDPKALESTSVSNSVTTNDHAKLIESNKVENGNDHKSANIFGKVESNKAESGCYQQPANIFRISESKDGKGNDEKAANIFGNLDAPASTALPGTPTNGISTTTTRTPAAIFSTSTPTPVIPSCVPALVFGFGSATSTTPTISVAEIGNTSVINDKDLKSNSPFASTPFSTTTTATTTTTGSGLFGFSSTAVTSTTKNHSKASFFNVSNESQANTQVVVTPSVPFLFGSGTTSIPSSTSGTSPFSSSASTIGTSSSFGISSMTASSQGKYGNSTSGPATSIFGSTWDPVKYSRFGTTYNFGASATPTPSATTSPVVFGASSSSGSTKYSFDAGVDATSSFSTPTQNQYPLTPVFGNSTSGPATSIFGSTWDLEKSSGFVTTYNDHMSMDIMEEDCMVAEDTHVFGTGATTNNYDHMSMDSMVEDCMQTPTPVPAFGQTSVASPQFTFDSATQPPMSSYALHPGWWPAKTSW